MELKQRILCSGPSMAALSGEVNEEGTPGLSEAAIEFLKQEGSGYRYTKDKIAHIRGNLRGGLLKQIHFHITSGATRAVLLYIETKVTLAPNYFLSFMCNVSYGSGTGNIFFMVSHANSPCVGVPFSMYQPRTSNTANAMTVGIRNSVFENLDHVKLVADTLTNKHLSSHDIYHMLNSLSMENAFAISRLDKAMRHIKTEVKECTERTTLFAVLSVIYASGLANTTAPRVQRKLGEIKAAVAWYLEQTMLAEVRIMSKHDPLPGDFYL